MELVIGAKAKRSGRVKVRDYPKHGATKVVVHDGQHHLDELMAIVLLTWTFPEVSVRRSRQPRDDEIWVDVGGVYDPKSNKFDHHQNDYTGPLSSVGMVWAKWKSLPRIRKLEPVLGRYILKKVFDEVDNCDNLGGYQEASFSRYVGLLSFREALEVTSRFMSKLLQLAKSFQFLETRPATEDRLGVVNASTLHPTVVEFLQDHFPKSFLYCVKFNGTFTVRPPMGRAFSQNFPSIFTHKTGFMCVLKTVDEILALGESNLKPTSEA
jgi:hypothetical protein